MGKKQMGMGAAGCGGLLAFLCLVSFCFWAFNVWVEPGGAISADEAFPGVLSSCCCGFISILIAGAGVFLFIKGKNEAQSPEQPQ